MIGKNSGISKIILIAAAAVLGLSCLAGVGILARSHGKHVKKSTVVQGPVTLLGLGELVVDLADTGEVRYAKADLSIGFTGGLADDKKDDMKTRMRDVAIQVLGSKRFDQLIEPGGKQALKAQLLAAANKRLKSECDGEPDNTAVKIYFNEFTMQ